MDELVKEQLKMFEDILKRKLTDDEVYLVRNSFQNGFSEGKATQRKEVVQILSKMS